MKENPWSSALRRFLERMKLTQIAAAEALGVSQAAISQWCNGQIPVREHLLAVERWSKGRVRASLALKAA